ncbi:MAG TPA: hypothetical protein VF066_15175 [Thermoleophilaceae bacterium]
MSKFNLVVVCAIAALVLAPSALAAAGDITSVAGNGFAAFSGDTFAATTAALNNPSAVSATADGGLLIADYKNNRIRKVSSSGVITTVAGTGTAGFSGDNAVATSAALNAPVGVTALSDGSFLIADSGNNRIRTVSTSGVIATIAGTGGIGFSGDGGQATAATLTGPTAVYPTADGGLLISDYKNNRIRKVSSTGVITTVAGTGTAGFSGDNGGATAAMIDSPVTAMPTFDGGFLIADSGNSRIRKVSSGGVITTVAGTGLAGFNGDGGAATAAQLSAPTGVQPTADGGYLVADIGNNRVRAVSAGGTITTVAGTGIAGFAGDGGAATAAGLSAPVAVAVGANGATLIADMANNRIRSIEGAPAPVPTLAPVPDPVVIPTEATPGPIETTATMPPSSDPPPFTDAPALTPVTLVLPRNGITATPSGAVPLAIRCPADADGHCDGTVTLQVAVRSALASMARQTTLTVARTKFSVAPGKKATVKVRLTRRGRALLAKNGGLTVTAKISRRGGPTLGQKDQTAVIKIKPSKRRPAKRARASAAVVAIDAEVRR